jgi:hypothetical protein
MSDALNLALALVLICALLLGFAMIVKALFL